MITILSQDKTTLMDCECVYIGTPTMFSVNVKNENSYCIKCEEAILGEYSTKENAQKVMEKIKSRSRINETLKLVGWDNAKEVLKPHFFNYSDIELLNPIFEMPQDEEE